MTGRLCTHSGVSIAVLLAASLFLATGCGGGGTQGGSGDSHGNDTTAIVLGLQTPLGLQGTRGVGPEVTIIYRLRDREFDRSDVEIEYGIDLDRDDEIDEDTEYFAASEVPYNPIDPSTSSSGKEDLQGSPGVGTIQYFVWDSIADLGTARYVTQDYVYSSDGRVVLDEFGEPVFQDFPGVRIRIRPIHGSMKGAWKSTDAFDVNSNNTPAAGFDEVVLTADGTANEDVVVNWRAQDPDGDPVTIAVDWVQIPESFDPSIATLETLEALPWQAASTGQIGEGTESLESSPTGLPHVWSWDSVADAGTMNGFIFFRVRPLDEKLEVGTWTYMTTTFNLDNYTIFTDPDAQLPDPSFNGRAVLLEGETVLYVGGSNGTEPQKTAAIFYPGLSQTTKGTVAAIGSGMAEARMEHTATRLASGLVLITGGRGTGGTYLDTAELYDPLTKSFTSVAGKMVEPRHNHTATLLRNGHVLLAGGANADGTEGTAEIYNPDTGTFSAAGTMVDARTMAKAVLLPAGRVLIAGGEDAGVSLETVEIFDPVAGSFAATDISNNMGEARLGLSLTATTHDPIAAIAAGGSAAGVASATIERFDWEQDEFTASAVAMQDSRSGHLAVLLGDGKVLMAGGMSASGIAATGDVYDVAGDSVDTPNGDMVVPVVYCAATSLVNGRPVMFGGQDGNGDATAQIQIFTPDGGFNYPPTAQIRTPTAVEPWAFGVRFNWRATDIEGDDVKINAQFRIKPSGTDDSGVLPSDLLDVWLPASMKDQTVLGEVSSGVTGLSSRKDYVTELENPIDAPDVDPGEHLFVWFTEDDIPKGNYDNVFFRIQVEGGTKGTTATSGRFSITDNAPVIARIETPLNESGNIVVPYYLQDSDAGNLARVVWEYGIDLNGDGKIVEADFEQWFTVTRSTVTATVGTDTYNDEGLTDLVTGVDDNDPNNDFTDANGTPWGKLHHMVWDSVYDLGAPTAPRSDIILRVTPYDYPASDPSAESLGIDNQVGGFNLEVDPNGLVLESWSPSVNNMSGPGYTFTGVKLDEPIVLNFSTPIDPLSVDRVSIQFTKVGGTGELVQGFFHVDNSSGKGVVTFYPQVQEIPARTDIFEEGTGYSLSIPGYDPKNRTRSVVQTSADAADTNARYNLLTISNPAALETGTGVLPDSGAPSVGPLVSPATTTNVATGTEIELSFDERLDVNSIDANGFLVTTELFSGVTSVIYGDMELSNITEWDGSKVVHYAVLVFTPDSPLPVGATITVSAKVGLTDLNGNALSAPSVTDFGTVATGTTNSGSFVESFDDATERDADLTTAFWGATDPNGIGSNGGIGVTGSLTGMHELGSGSDEGDIVWDSNKTFTIDTDVQDEWEFQTLTIPADHTLILKGSAPAILRVIGDVLVEGTIDAAGRGGGEGVWYDAFNETSGDGVQGGRGGPGGGDGASDGSYTWNQTVAVTAESGGGIGYGAGSSSNGKSGAGGLIRRSSPYSYDYYGAGASGAGHANAGEDGTYGYYSGTYKKTVQKGGSSYGDASLKNGLEAGSGGGCGGSVCMTPSSTSGVYTYKYVGYASGGAGGGGGGALQIAAGGKVTVTKAGKILANGGDGGDCFVYAPYNVIHYRTTNSSYKYYLGLSSYTAYPGGGGGGSGGTVHVKAGGGHEMHGILDVSGGRGGNGRKYHYLSYSYAYNEHWGGAGGDGRIKVEGPNLIDPSTGVNFKGVIAVGTAAAISGGSGTTSWTVSGNVTVNTDSGSGAPSGTYDSTTRRFNLKDFTVNSGATLTVTGTRPFLVYASGNVSISGKIDASGKTPTTQTSWGAYGSSSGFRAYLRVLGAAGVAGGGKGGDSAPSNYTSYVKPPHPGYAGSNAWNTTKGAGQVSTSWKPWNREYSYQYSTSSATQYYYSYYYFGGVGGGGGSAEPGKQGVVTVSNWTGENYDGGPFASGGTRTVDADTLSEASLTGGGGGAAGGLNGGYRYYYEYLNSSGTATSTYAGYCYGYGLAGAGGGGGGGVMIKSSGTITVNSAGQIDVSGGDGGSLKPTSYTYAMYSSAGSGGGAGNVLLEAKSGFSFGAGCTIDASGGQGGVTEYKSTSSYYDYGTSQYTFGGEGGRGAIVLRADTLPEVLNVGQVTAGKSGSFDSDLFALTRDGVSKWQDSGTHAPDYLTMTTTGSGIANLYIEGAHVDPMSGDVDENTATGWIKLADIDDADGYRYFRFKCELSGSSVSGSVPTIDSVTTTWESEH